MTARSKLLSYLITGAEMDPDVAIANLAGYRAEVLTEEAAELKAHCLEHNQFAAKGFAECPCRVADELLRRAKVAGRGE